MIREDAIGEIEKMCSGGEDQRIQELERLVASPYYTWDDKLELMRLRRERYIRGSCCK